MIARLVNSCVQWRCVSAGLGAVAVMALSVSGALAASMRVKMACSGDYYAHCSKFPSDSDETRRCMRAVGDRLSAGCVSALVAAGEVSQAEVSRRAASLKKK